MFIINIIFLKEVINQPGGEAMKKEKPKLNEKELTGTIDEQAIDKSALLKKKKKNKQVDETPTAAVKIKKAKPEKDVKGAAEPKDLKAPKDDKLNKFLVSMKKSMRKSVKKEAAEVGVSMNEYIVLAVEEKLRKSTLKL